MATLTNTKIKDTYDGLLKTADNDVIGASEKNITDGLGNATILSIGTDSASFSSDIEVNGLTIGLGSGDIVTNTALGADALSANTTGAGNSAVGLNTLRYNTSGAWGTAVGYEALKQNTTGQGNTAFGAVALQDNTIGSNNTAVGYISLSNNIDGADNTAVGYSSLGSNTTGSQNVAIGRSSLSNNTTGGSNTALGYNALNANVIGGNNVAIGRSSLILSTGSFNTAVGSYSLNNNTTANNNTAIGYLSLYHNTTGGNNVAVGNNSSGLNTTGLYNTAVGSSALYSNETGGSVVAIGYRALYANTVSNNTAIGSGALEANTTGGVNTALGKEALNANTTGGGNTAIGYQTLQLQTSNSHNTAVGHLALQKNTNSYNTAVGSSALQYNTDGQQNAAFGYFALRHNTTGSQNSSLGNNALRDNISGAKNTAVGESALANNLSSDSNTAVGWRALYISEGAYNTAVGSNALDNNSTGSFNSAIGYNSLTSNTTGAYNISIGVNSLLSNTDGDLNVAVGYAAGDSKTSGDNNIYIGNQADGASATTSNEIVIGSLATGNGSDTATYGNGDITDHYFTAGNVHIVGDLTVGGTMPSSDLDLTGTPYGEGDILTVSSSGTLTKIDKDTAAEYLGVNSISLMRDLSFGESYINNFRSRVIDNTGTYFPTPAGYSFGVYKNKGYVNKMGVALLPSGVKSGGLFSVKPSNGNGDFDFTRASTATYVDEDGLIAVAPSGTPRLNYPIIDGVVQDTPSLLLEPQRTNLFSYSNDFTNAIWTKTLTTVTSNAVISPLGDLSGSALVPSSASGQHRVLQSVSVTGGTFTCYIKADELDSIIIHFLGASARGFRANGTNGTTFAATGIGIDPTSYDIQYHSNGWYKCTMYDSGSITRVDIYIVKQGETYVNWASNDSDKIYLSLCQMEAGSYPTSYIPTSGSAVTRNAEVCNGAGTSADFNDSEGVLFAEISALANDGENRGISISDGTTNNRVRIGYTVNDDVLRFVLSSGGTLYVDENNIEVSSVLNYNKIAAKYKTDDFALWINGFELATDTSGSTPIGLDTLKFNNANDGQPFYGKTKQLITFKEALTDAELEELTSWQSFNDMAEAQEYKTY